MTNLCVLPHSSASVERIFSMVNCLVTNELKAETVKDRLLAKQNMARNNGSCCTWEPPLALIQDLENGTVYKRYQNRITKKKKDLNNINIEAGGEVDEEA